MPWQVSVWAWPCFGQERCPSTWAELIWVKKYVKNIGSYLPPLQKIRMLEVSTSLFLQGEVPPPFTTKKHLWIPTGEILVPHGGKTIHPTPTVADLRPLWRSQGLLDGDGFLAHQALWLGFVSNGPRAACNTKKLALKREHENRLETVFF